MLPYPIHISILVLWCATSLVATVSFSARAAIIWNDNREVTALLILGSFSALCFVIALLIAVHLTLDNRH